MSRRKRFYIALACYAALAFLIWLTIDNIPIPATNLPEALQGLHITLRQLTLAVLAMFVLRTVLYWRAEEIRAERDGDEEKVRSETR